MRSLGAGHPHSPTAAARGPLRRARVMRMCASQHLWLCMSLRLSFGALALCKKIQKYRSEV